MTAGLRLFAFAAGYRAATDCRCITVAMAVCGAGLVAVLGRMM